MGNLRNVHSPYTKKLQQQQRERELKYIEENTKLERRLFITLVIIASSITGLIFLYMRAYPA